MGRKKLQQEAVLVLHDIRSAHNVGSIFRTADAAGIAKIYLSGLTPSPVDRFGRWRCDIAKVALGAEKAVLWEHVEQIVPLLSRLKAERYGIIAVEQSSDSQVYTSVKVPRRTAFVFGNEVDGLPKSVLHGVDIVAEIPMKGMKESLNVSVAVGVALFGMLNV